MPQIARYAANNLVNYQKAQDKQWLETTKMQQALSTHPELIKPLNAGKDLSQCNFPQKCMLMGAVLSVLTPATHAAKTKSVNGQHTQGVAQQSTHSAHRPNYSKQMVALSAKPAGLDLHAVLSMDGGRQNVGDLRRSRYDVPDFSTKLNVGQAMRLPRASDKQPMTETSAQAFLKKIGEDVQVEAFRLFGLQRGAVNTTNEILRGAAEPGSVAQKMESYIASQSIQSKHPMAQHLLNNYLSYPAKLDLTYRVLGHSPGELPLHREICVSQEILPPGEPQKNLTPSQQEMLSNFMYRVIKKTAETISLHTQFTLSEAQHNALPNIHVLNKLCDGDLGSGTTEQPSGDFHFALHVPELSDANATQDTRLERLANITDAFRIRYAGQGVRILIEPSLDVMSDPGEAEHMVRHEWMHALGLPDTHTEQALTKEQTELSYLCVNPLERYGKVGIMYCSGSSQSLMPYDIFALDEIANLVRHEQAQRSGHPAIDNPLKKKSPHRGNTHYRFVPGSNVIKVTDQREHGVSASYVMQPDKTDGCAQYERVGAAPDRTQPEEFTYVFRTLVDPSGYDSLDFRNYKTNIKVDIRPGAASLFNHSALVCGVPLSYINRGGPVAYAAGNIYLPASPDASYLIERVIGGDGDDEIHGNALDNTFYPGKGRDIVTGGGGCDTFVFRPGDKKLTITDFDTQCDRLALEARSGVKDHRKLMQRSHQKENGDLEIRLRRHEKIILKNKAGQHLSANNLLILAHRNRFYR